MTFAEIKTLFDPDMNDDLILNCLDHKPNTDWLMWHHLPEKNIRNILGLLVPEERTKEKVMLSVQDDVEYLTLVRGDYGLTDPFALDNSLLYKIAKEYWDKDSVVNK